MSSVFRVFRVSRLIRRVSRRFGVAAEGEGPDILGDMVPLLILARQLKTLKLLALGGVAAAGGPMGLLVAGLWTTLAVASFLPEENPDDRRRREYKNLFGEAEGEAKFMEEFINRTIEIDLTRRSA